MEEQKKQMEIPEEEKKKDVVEVEPEEQGFEENADTKIVVEKLEEFTKTIEFEKPTQNQQQQVQTKFELRRIPVPPHRMTPLKNNWDKIVTTIVQNLKLQIRMNTKRKSVEIKTSEFTVESSAIQRAADFLKAFMLGFDLNDSIALLRLDNLYIESFEIKDVKNLHGDHLSRCIGRLTGEKGKTKYAIENATKTRIIIADQKIHILGSFSNIKSARDALCSLILGSPPGKVYSQLKYISKRYSEKF